MSLLILFLSGLFWAIFDLVRKIALQSQSLLTVIYITIFSQLIIFMMSLLLSKLLISSNDYYPLLIIISILNLISLYCFLKALKIQEISMCIPLLSYSPLFSLIFSKILLDESLSISQHIGIIIIFIGSFILYSKSLHFKDLLYSPFALIKNKSAQLMIIVTIIWSAIPVLDKKSLNYTDIYMHGFLQSLLGFLFLFFFIRYKGEQRIAFIKNKKSFITLIILIIIGFLASITQLFALTINLVPILEVVKRATGILLALFFGYFFFKEDINKKKVYSITVIIIGLSFVI